MYSRKVEGNIAKACSHNIRISVKNAKPVCKSVRGLELKRAKKFLEEVLKEKKNINGRFYSKTTREILNIISSAEKNAEFKNLDINNMYIFHISALEGTHMHRRRRKTRFGTKMKSAHLEVILKEKGSRKVAKEEIKEKKTKEQKTEQKVEKDKKVETKEPKTGQKVDTRPSDDAPFSQSEKEGIDKTREKERKKEAVQESGVGSKEEIKLKEDKTKQEVQKKEKIKSEKSKVELKEIHKGKK